MAEHGKFDVLINLEIELREWADDERRTAEHLKKGQFHEQAYVCEQVAKAYEKAANEVARQAGHYRRYMVGGDIDG